MSVQSVVLEPGAVLCRDGLLTAEQCALLIEDLEFAWWWDSPLVRLGPDGALHSHTSHRRTSRTTSESWLGEEARAVVRALEQRLLGELGLPPANVEPWQLSRYRRGDHFDEHHDAGYFGADPSGERTTTFLVYLEGAAAGGSTWFPRLHQRFQPVPGRVLVWANLDADGSVDDRMRHVACPVRSRKTILTTWVRERPIQSSTATPGLTPSAGEVSSTHTDRK